MEKFKTGVNVSYWFEKEAGGYWDGEYSIECPVCGKMLSGFPISFGGDTLGKDAALMSRRDKNHAHMEGLELLCKNGISRMNQIKDSIKEQIEVIYSYYSDYDFIWDENHDVEKRYSGYILLFAQGPYYPKSKNVMPRLLGIAEIHFRAEDTKSYSYPLLCNRETFTGTKFGDPTTSNMRYFALLDCNITKIYLLNGSVITTNAEFLKFKSTCPYKKVCCNRYSSQQKDDMKTCWILSYATYPELTDIEVIGEKLKDPIYVNINITGDIFYSKPYTLFTSLNDAIEFIKLWDAKREKIISKSHKLVIEG